MKTTFLEKFLTKHNMALDNINMSKEVFAEFTSIVNNDFKYIVLAAIDGSNSWGSLGYFYNFYDSSDGKLSPYRLWMDNNCIDEWVLLDFKFYFKNSTDALRFKLIWGYL